MTRVHDAAKQILASALNIEQAAVNDSTALGDTPQWDSIAHLNLILSLEERLSRQLGPEEIVGVKSIHDVIVLLEGKE